MTSGRTVLGHSGGIDEMLFVLVPLLVFLTLQWLNRRKAGAGTRSVEDTAASLERRRRLAGGLIPGTSDADAEDSTEGSDRPEQGM